MLPQIIYEVDTKGTLTYANRIAFELFGYNEDEFRQGLNVIQIIAPADHERAASAIRAMLNGTGRTTRVTEEYLARRKDGSEFPVAIYSSAIVTRGRITGLRGIIVDITDRRLAQERIRESEQRYRNIVEDQTEFICRFRPDGTHVFVNEAYCRYFQPYAGRYHRAPLPAGHPSGRPETLDPVLQDPDRGPPGRYHRTQDHHAGWQCAVAAVERPGDL